MLCLIQQSLINMFGEATFQINQKSIFRLPLLHGLTENLLNNFGANWKIKLFIKKKGVNTTRTF